MTTGLMALPAGWTLPRWSMFGGRVGSVLGSRGGVGGVLGSGRGGARNGLITGLVAYWGLDEASGDALDKHSGNLTLAQVNGPGIDVGKVYATARVAEYSGQRYFTRPSSTTLQCGTASFAFAAWIYPTNFNNTHFAISKRTSTYSSLEYLIGMSASGYFFILGNGTTPQQVTVAGATYDAWALIVCWYDSTAGTINLAVNNGTPASLGFAGSPSQSSAVFNIGAYANLNLYTGRVGPVAFWKNRTLDNAARDALWNGGAGLAYAAFTS